MEKLHNIIVNLLIEILIVIQNKFRGKIVQFFLFF